MKKVVKLIMLSLAMAGILTGCGSAQDESDLSTSPVLSDLREIGPLSGMGLFAQNYTLRVGQSDVKRVVLENRSQLVGDRFVRLPVITIHSIVAVYEGGYRRDLFRKMGETTDVIKWIPGLNQLGALELHGSGDRARREIDVNGDTNLVLSHLEIKASTRAPRKSSLSVQVGS